MSWGIGPEKIGRGYERNLNVGPFQPMVSSFDLHLRDEKKSPRRSAPTSRVHGRSPLGT
jgi:hypothetical protein